RYLSSAAAVAVRDAYKCRTRSPWYVVPDVWVPHAFLTYMSGETPALVANEAGCVCTNSVHAIRLTGDLSISELQSRWSHPLTKLSCELEGHPLGGGILKLEPREASRVLLLKSFVAGRDEQRIVREGIETMRGWRHHGG